MTPARADCVTTAEARDQLRAEFWPDENYGEGPDFWKARELVGHEGREIGFWEALELRNAEIDAAILRALADEDIRAWVFDPAGAAQAIPQSYWASPDPGVNPGFDISNGRLTRSERYGALLLLTRSAIRALAATMNVRDEKADLLPLLEGLAPYETFVAPPPRPTPTSPRELPDAFVEPTWNASQVLGWIWTRNRVLMCECSSQRSGRAVYYREFADEHDIGLSGNDDFVVYEWPARSIEMIAHRAKPGNEMFWSSVKKELRATLASGRLAATGLANDSGDQQAVPAIGWESMAFYLGTDGYYAGPDDPYREGASWWRDLRFPREDVERLWPAAGAPVVDTIPDVDTGTPGRPSMAEWFIGEHQRRLAAGDALAAVKEEASALLEWLRREHPGYKQYPVARTIENRIRTDHRAAFPSGQTRAGTKKGAGT